MKEIQLIFYNSCALCSHDDALLEALILEFLANELIKVDYNNRNILRVSIVL